MLKLSIVILGFSMSIYFLKWFSNGPVCLSDATVNNKVVIITGANVGLGKETAFQLALRGGKVYMACRSLQRCAAASEELRQKLNGAGEVIPILLDLASRKSIEHFVEEFKAKERRLDILINNAGLATDIYAREETENGFEITFGVNHLGHFLLTISLVDLLLAAKPSRIINVSAKAHVFGDIDWYDVMMTEDYNSLKAYARSKTANILFTRSLHDKLSAKGVTSYSLHPGVFATEILRNLQFLQYPIIGDLYNVLSWPFVKDVFHGAQTTICCAIHEEIVRDSGQYFSDCAVDEMSEQAKSDEAREKLWNLSLKLWKLNTDDLHPSLR